ncbi:unnamed protein product, partial [Mesorhabditis belari]|uniref:MSP domain-containing protein n=1 Tax=Mesorhabditis belari TaxID=2138241 RepID=A0AAF3JA01_9BILA
MWIDIVFCIFLFLVAPSSQFACPTLSDTQFCQADVCLFASNQTDEGTVQWAGCHSPPEALNFPVKGCVEALEKGISNICLQKGKIHFCCCQGEHCNIDLIKEFIFDIGLWDLVRLIGGLSIVLTVFLFCAVVGFICKRYFTRTSDQSMPKVRKALIIVYGIQIFIVSICWCLHLIPLPSKCPEHPNGRISIPIGSLFVSTHSLLIAIIFWADIAYILVKARHLATMKKKTMRPLTHWIDQTVIVVAFNMLMSIPIAIHYYSSTTKSKKYCTNDVSDWFLASHSSLIAFVLLMDVYLALFIAILECKKRNKIEAIETGTSSIAEKTENTMLTTAQRMTSHDELIVEPRPFWLSSKGEGVLAITNNTTLQWLAVRVLISSPTYYRISPKHLLLPPQRKATVEVSMKLVEQKSMKEHAIMVEWFDVGSNYLSSDPAIMWQRPYKAPPLKWSHQIFSIFYEPQSASGKDLLSHPVDERFLFSTRPQQTTI